ncbi:MAG TPA: 50S ribosomal protein L35 [Polyangia bacterium]|jgi:large subunit ribosomal protein L35
MPKQKSNSGAKKRFRLTAKGKVRIKKAYHSHILTKKSPKQLRRLRRRSILDKAQSAQVKRMIPYA